MKFSAQLDVNVVAHELDDDAGAGIGDAAEAHLDEAVRTLESGGGDVPEGLRDDIEPETDELRIVAESVFLRDRSYLPRPASRPTTCAHASAAGGRWSAAATDFAVRRT